MPSCTSPCAASMMLRGSSTLVSPNSVARRSKFGISPNTEPSKLRTSAEPSGSSAILRAFSPSIRKAKPGSESAECSALNTITRRRLRASRTILARSANDGSSMDGASSSAMTMACRSLARSKSAPSRSSRASRFRPLSASAVSWATASQPERPAVSTSAARAGRALTRACTILRAAPKGWPASAMSARRARSPASCPSSTQASTKRDLPAPEGPTTSIAPPRPRIARIICLRMRSSGASRATSLGVVR